MSWYYAAEGKQNGPVTEEQFQALVAMGTIRGDTLVWREGMQNWQPYASTSVAASASLGGAPEAGAPVSSTAGGVICAECRQPFPVEQTARFGDAFVCERCKPLYVQRLREGAVTQPGESRRYGGFWIRVVAKIIDGLIVGVPIIVLLAVFGGTLGYFQTGPAGNTPSAAMAMLGLQLGLQAIAMVINGAYAIFFVTKFQATPGKMVFGLIVVNADGSRLSAGKATGRFFADILSQITCYIGYIVAGFDAEKRALHDHICSTRVVYKNR